MSRIDRCQPIVERALEKEGWYVSKHPIHIYSPDSPERDAYIDLRATRGINGKTKQAFFCEVKCFASSAQRTTDLYTGIGQYLVYRELLDRLNNSTPLYLAVPLPAYSEIFDPVIQTLVIRYKIKLLIVDLTLEVVVEWKE